MRIYHKKKDETVDISDFITSVTLSGDFRSASRTCDFGIISNLQDPNFPSVVLALGDVIQVRNEDKIIFHGVIWDRSRKTDSKEVSYVARDLGIYLNKNQANYNLEKITPEAITEKICKEFDIKMGLIEKTDVQISRKFVGSTLYDIIMTAYTLATDKKYMCFFTGEKLNVIEKGQTTELDLDEMNLLSGSISESLDDMVNRIEVLNDKDKPICSFENEEDIKKYKVMQEIFRADKKENIPEGKKLLHGVTSKMTVSNFGDPSFVSGRKVYYVDPFTQKKGSFYIDTDEHNWKNGIYTNKLTLNFENLMDEKEGGQ